MTKLERVLGAVPGNNDLKTGLYLARKLEENTGGELLGGLPPLHSPPPFFFPEEISSNLLALHPLEYLPCLL